MAQVNQSMADSEDWAKGPGEFYVQSKSTVVNRRSEPNNPVDIDNVRQFNRSYQHNESEEQRSFSSARYRDARSVDSIGTEIRVNVRPTYPTIEIPINHPNTPSMRWMNSNYDNGQLAGNSFREMPQIVNPPTARYNTVREPMDIFNTRDSEIYQSRRRSNRNNSRQIISQVQIPPLTPIRHMPNYESQQMDSDGTTSRRRNYIRNEPPYPKIRDNSMPALVERVPTRSKSRCHYCHHCNRHRAHSSSSRHENTQPLPNQFSNPYAYPSIYTPTIPFCPHCQSGMNTLNPLTPFNVQRNGIFSPVILPPMQYIPTPITPNIKSLPRRLSKRPSTKGVKNYTPLHQSMMEKPLSQYHCICCPEGQHRRQKTRNNAAFFATDSEGNLSDVNVTNFERNYPSRPHTINRSMQNTTQQPSPFQRTFAEQHLTSVIETNRSRSTPKPSGYVVTVQDAQQSPSPGIERGEMSKFVFNENMNRSSFTKHENNWSAEKHGSVMRDDGFPNDYVDLIDTAIEFAAEEDKDDEFPLEKRLIVTLAEAAIDNAESPSQVAGNLKKAMDERFSPVWQVVAGTGAYGSNIASINGKLLHFKAFGWAFLIWKTA